MNNPIYLIPVLIPFMFIFVSFLISKMGWSALAANYQTEAPFDGTKVGLISAKINSANYNNSLLLDYNNAGIYLRPIFLFKLFHKPVLIPWKEIKEVRDKNMLLFTSKELMIGSPFVANIVISERVYDQFRRYIHLENINH